MSVQREQRKTPSTVPPTDDSDCYIPLLRNATGTENRLLQDLLVNQLAGSLWCPENSTHEQQVNRLKATLAVLESIRPKDEIEGLLAAQMAATHNVGLECLRRAMLKNIHLEDVYQNLKHAEKLFSIFTQQTAALDKRRGKSQQKVTVEYVNVEAGGQAIVGNVERRRAPALAKKRLGIKRKQGNGLAASAHNPRETCNNGAHTPEPDRQRET